jgi:hypothetical protein
LHRARGFDARSDRSRGIGSIARTQMAQRDGGQREVQIDAIEQRTGEARPVSMHVGRRALAWTRSVARVPARTRIHGRDECEPRRVRHHGRRSRDHHASVLERLTQRLERMSWELEQLVEKQHAMVRETHFARAR